MEEKIEDMQDDINAIADEISNLKSENRHIRNSTASVIQCAKTCRDMRQMRECMEKIDL